MYRIRSTLAAFAPSPMRHLGANRWRRPIAPAATSLRFFARIGEALQRRMAQCVTRRREYACYRQFINHES